MTIRRKPAQQSSTMLADQDSRNFSERRKLPPLRDRFRVEAASGADDSEAMLVRSRALAIWALERWLEDRKAGITGDGILQSRKRLIQTSRDELN